jgi:adenosylcobinamide-phosphate synthase
LRAIIFSVSFLAILFALLIEQVRPLVGNTAVHDSARRYSRWAARSFDAGKDGHAWIVWSVVALAPAVTLMLFDRSLVWSLGWTGLMLSFVLHTAVLYATLGFRHFSHHVTAIRDALDAGDEDTARLVLAKWKQVETADLPRSEIVRHVIEHSMIAAHRHVFGVLGWYALLSAFGLGPAGAVLYRFAEFAQRYFRSQDGVPIKASPALTLVASKAWYLIDWLPARVSALGFAIVGNFEDAIDNWRTDASRKAPGEMLAKRWGVGMTENDAVILSATAGALNVRLGGDALRPAPANPFNTSSALVGVPVKGASMSVEPVNTSSPEAQQAHLRSAVGLVWRCVVLWMLLLALLTLARLLG